MRALLVLSLACVAAAVLSPGRAAADTCSSPAATTWIDAVPPQLATVFGKAGLVVSVGSGDFPAQMRQLGADTVHWDNNLKARVGTTTDPADPATVADRANRLFDYAVQQSGCATPWIAENELFGAGLETPWSDTNTVYRQNVLTYLQTLAARGARPFLLINSTPYTGGAAAAWWQQVAAVADIVREDYFSDKAMYQSGPILGNRQIRESIRSSITRFLAIGIPASRLGVMLGFETGSPERGRAGLEPVQAWFDVVKWQALAAKEVAQELHFSTIWSWGWTFGNIDPDIGRAACVWVWARSPSLCNGPGAAGAGFDPSTTDGQLVLPPGTQCIVGRDRISNASISQLEAVTRDPEVAYTAVFARTIESRLVRPTHAQVLAAERVLIADRFGGSRAAYASALSDESVPLATSRAILGDEVRRELLELRMKVPTPSSAQVESFYASYPDMPVRAVKAKPAPSWLGGKPLGYALQATAPEGVFRVGSRRPLAVQGIDRSYVVRAVGGTQPLGTIPLALVAPAIRAALASFARAEAYERWTSHVQTLELDHAICRDDDLPTPAPSEVSTFVPNLALGPFALG